MRYILGGGLIALLARDILGDGWTIIPIGRSRYFSYTPAIADNYVVKDPVIDEYMHKFAIIPLMYKIGYSIAGQILYNPTIPLPQYLAKVYGDAIPPQAMAYWRSKSEHFGYGDCAEMYRILQHKYADELGANNIRFGQLTGINDGEIRTSTGLVVGYDEILSTIPLPALLGLLGIRLDLPGRDIYCYHIRTKQLDFEGGTQLLVADPEIDFHTATMLNKENYLFYSCKSIEYPGRYFMNFMKEFDLIGETSVKDSVCCGPIPSIPEVGAAKIRCMGSSAVWDDCLDVGSCIKRLLKMGV